VVDVASRLDLAGPLLKSSYRGSRFKIQFEQKKIVVSSDHDLLNLFSSILEEYGFLISALPLIHISARDS